MVGRRPTRAYKKKSPYWDKRNNIIVPFEMRKDRAIIYALNFCRRFGGPADYKSCLDPSILGFPQENKNLHWDAYKV
jgi:hypothetical protein